MEDPKERLVTSISTTELERRWEATREMMRDNKIDFLIMRMIYKNSEILEALLDKVTGFLLAFGLALMENGANIIFLPELTASASKNPTRKREDHD